ncbi:MAG: hypothetical protein PVH68_02130 [Armatimonadota bacterium]|jgi:hypothetical protein
MSARDRIIITISVAACACVVGYWALLRPTSIRLARSKQALATMQDDLADAVRLRRTSVEETLHTAGIWTAEEASAFLQELARMAATRGARLVSVSVADPRRVNEPEHGSASTIDYGLFEMKVSAKFQGPYAAVRSLLAALHDHEPRLQLTEVGLTAEEADPGGVAAATEMKFFVFQHAAGSKPVGPTPTADIPPTTVAMVPDAPSLPSPFRHGPPPLEPDEPSDDEAGPGASGTMAFPPDLPDVSGDEPDDEEAVPPLEGPRAVLTGIVGGQGRLLAAISVEDRTRLYAPGDRLANDATVAAVATEGIQLAVLDEGGERMILARTGQPIAGYRMPPDAGGLPWEEPTEEPRPVLPHSAGTVSGPAGAVGLIREEGRTYVARVGDVIADGLQIVAIEDGNVYVADADAGPRPVSQRIALPREGG